MCSPATDTGTVYACSRITNYQSLSPTEKMTYPQSNRTWQIIHDAQKGGYAVGAFCVYVHPQLPSIGKL